MILTLIYISLLKILFVVSITTLKLCLMWYLFSSNEVAYFFNPTQTASKYKTAFSL